MDNSLRVNPDGLIDGAQRFRETHDALRAVLTKVHNEQDSLRSKWTGSAATTGDAMWSDLHDVLSAHIDRLADTADKLHAAAGVYVDRDGESSAALNEQV